MIEDISSSWNRAYGHLSANQPNEHQLERTALGLVTRWLERGELPAAGSGHALPEWPGTVLDEPTRAYLAKCIECMHFAAGQDGATCLIRKRLSCDADGEADAGAQPMGHGSLRVGAPPAVRHDRVTMSTAVADAMRAARAVG